MTAPLCSECNGPLPPDALRGVCPRCLLRRGLEPAPDEDEAGSTSEGSIRLLLGDGTVAPLPFREIGDYDLLEQIGHGGMGVIFKARQRSLDRLVAVKLIRSERSARPADIARFRTEAAAAARLQHPNIVGIYEVGEHAGHPFYSMEFVPGRSLAEALREGPFPPHRAAHVVQTVAEAIHFAHQQGVLHRDLKPSNILLDLEEEPRVADFGLAKILQGDSEPTLTGAVLGSPHYMPPEQARGRSAEATARSDVYSLGAILYELLTGRPPFSAATPLETLRLVIEQDPIPPRALNPALPRDLETVCLKCLAKEPASRYASAQDLADELDRFLAGEPVRARPVTAAERAWRWCRRKPALAVLGAVLALAPAVIIAGLLVMDSRVRRERNLTRQNLYAADIAVAANALQQGNLDLAGRSLDPYRRTDTRSTTNSQSSKDLRGFEWRWLSQRAQGDAQLTLAAHSRAVNAVAFSPDGRFLASASEDGTTKVWAAVGDLARDRGQSAISEPWRVFTDEEAKGWSRMMFSAAFTADSRRLLTCSGRALSLWDLESGQRLWSHPTNRFKDVVFSPTDTNLALILPQTWATPLMGFLDVAGGHFTRYFTNGRADAVCFAPDGRRLARWDRDPPRRISIEDFPSGNVTASFDTVGKYVQLMAFTPDGRTLAVCNLWDGPIELFDVSAQKSTEPLVGHTGRCQALAISPDGRWLASGGFDQTIRLWDLASRRELRQWRGHRGAVGSLAFSPDGRRVCSGGFDGTVRFWDTDPLAPAPALTNVHGAFAFSPDGRWLVTQNSNGLTTLRELPSRLVLQDWKTPRFQSAVFTTDGLLLTASIGSAGEPPCVRSFLLSTSNAAPTGVRPLPATCNFQFANLTSACSAIALSPDGRVTVTGYRDGTVACWNTGSGRLLHLATRAFTNSVGYATRRTFAALNPLVFSADGKTVAAISFDYVEIKTWAMPGFSRIGGRVFGSPYEVPLAFSPDGRQLAMGGPTRSQGTTIHLWDAALSQPETELHGHLDHLHVVAYSPDGRTLATGAADGQLKLWHLPTQREVCTIQALPLGTLFGQVSFSPDGAWLGASDSAGNLQLFHAPPLSELDAGAGL